MLNYKFYLKTLLVFVIIVLAVYFMGPKIPMPTFEVDKVELPESLKELEAKINTEEKETIGIKPGNEAQIIWADSSKQKTKIAFLYIHGQ